MTSKVDPAGTTPGLITEVEAPPTFNMPCKNDGCDSIKATQIVIPGQPNQRIYKCVKCHRTWGANVGGSVNL